MLMFFVFALATLVSLSPSTTAVFLDKRENIAQNISLRIEGSQTTIFEDLILTRGHIVTTPSGGSHQCNGLNNHSNPFPGPTATSALDDASKKKGFPVDGTFSEDFDDFLITSIGPDAQTDTEFWGLLVNFQFAQVGGCQLEVKPGQKVLWAFNAFNVTAFLDLSGPTIVQRGQRAAFRVIDGESRNPIARAIVGGQLTDINGHVQLVFNAAGEISLKASKEGTIRSNALNVLVV
ncbi:hypothetical protein BT96DRAFT_890637 [Gymnopus androsaceus JB14]|uniref:Transcobalamin-like C-terminal domain-containing protein n=1 Tax=Gymnopus androsaceus JB14 TaxID=1447944 RepID=A0A6A4GT00_9AGAR|nr:hypothetical protein BT96DRAFT_890637 [Gymnopus androsaceus JB14]